MERNNITETSQHNVHKGLVAKTQKRRTGRTFTHSIGHSRKRSLWQSATLPLRVLPEHNYLKHTIKWLSCGALKRKQQRNTLAAKSPVSCIFISARRQSV